MTTTTVLFANDANSALAGSITNVATTANLTPGSGVLFPSPGANEYFVGTFIDAATGLIKEIVHVTNVTSDTITMVRAQEGTTALAWNAGDKFSNLMTAGTAAIFRQTGVPVNLASSSDVANILPLSNMPAADIIGGIAPMQLHAGNPNGFVAGSANVNGASSMCYDTSGHILYICTSTGSTSTAVWTSSTGSNNIFNGGTSGGSANAQTLATITPAGYAFADNIGIVFTPGFTNTLSTTLNDGTVTKTIQKMVAGSLVNLTAGDLVVSDPSFVVSNGTVWVLQDQMLGTAASKAASDSTKSTLASINGATTVGHLAKFSDTAGTITDFGSSTPTVQVFTSGSGTYTKPAGVTWIQVELIGGGGGGGSDDTNDGSAGGATTFSILTGGGAAGGAHNGGIGGSGGSGSGGDVNILGGSGSSGVVPGGAAQNAVGGIGGSGVFGGGAGSPVSISSGGKNGATNSGGGGSGASGHTGTSPAGSGGGAGGYTRKIIAPVSATYSYGVGAGGNGGSGTLGGGNGASGIIIVTEYYV